jgi:hypothetical protein
VRALPTVQKRAVQSFEVDKRAARIDDRDGSAGRRLAVGMLDGSGSNCLCAIESERRSVGDISGHAGAADERCDEQRCDSHGELRRSDSQLQARVLRGQIED